ncbi:MAG: DUF4258 domain-containing protein [Nitrospira sp.]|nr:DUF4258 domain-containing protein [Nitrospira sp.]
MSHYPLVFRVHAIQRMFQRRISKDEVRQVVVTGEIVESYPTDKPFPSRLILGWSGPRPLHVVAADDVRAEETPMTCVICKSGETQPGTATVTLEREGATVVIKRVPARVCKNCGEEYVEESVTASLLKTAEEAVRAGVQVDVRTYAAA